MKKITAILCVTFLTMGFQTAEAQIWKKIKKKAEKRVAEKADKKINEVLNPNKKEEEQKKKEESKKTKPVTNGKEAKVTDGASEEIWRNYKFIPGEKVIFYDDLLTEEVGEFPSRWDLVKGGAEVARFNGEKVIIGTAKYSNRVIPLFKEKNYLSDEFTVEFDIYVDHVSKENNNSWADYNLYLTADRYDAGSNPDVSFNLRHAVTNGHVESYNFQIEKTPLGPLNAWHHLALSYHKGKFKMYYDDKRIINLPKLTIVPDIIAIDFDGHTDTDEPVQVAIKNIRIAHGGGQMYKRILADGKYSTQGILFDTAKATLKPESYGIITKLTDMMTDNKDWRFEIVGHTDTDGETAVNLALSKKRAEAVKQALINNGIQEERLSTDGKGESEPLNANSTPEEKANNRRVEFILKSA
ncbi:OmpA family protein [Spongiimicrobium salis]|uniref:OmpA family protein n=1 Tax=Spongiimicrobium salis TaxID=1667022 RepID=UPI00374D275F